jgi:hypothetical protein
VDKGLQERAEHLKKALLASWDAVVLIDGIEGSGKSSLAFILALELDKSFCLERIVFTPEQFLKAVDEAQAGEAIVWDEFITGGMSTEFITLIQRTLTKKMTMIRKKNLYIIWVMPYFFMVGRYFAVARSRMLLHAYTPDGISRGVYHHYNYERKKRMFFRGRREFDYCVPYSNKGKFYDFFKYHNNVIDPEAYEAKKDEAIHSLDKPKEKPPSRHEKRLSLAFNKLARYCRDEKYMRLVDICRITGYKEGQMKKYLLLHKYYENPDDSHGDRDPDNPSRQKVSPLH